MQWRVTIGVKRETGHAPLLHSDLEGHKVDKAYERKPWLQYLLSEKENQNPF